jgi:hypothetical protein
LRAAFEERVRESGLAANAFITECVFGRSRHRPAELKALARILATCASIADEVRRLSKQPHSLSSHVLDEIVRELRIIRTSLMRMIGRKS